MKLGALDGIAKLRITGGVRSGVKVGRVEYSRHPRRHIQNHRITLLIGVAFEIQRDRNDLRRNMSALADLRRLSYHSEWKGLALKSKRAGKMRNRDDPVANQARIRRFRHLVAGFKMSLRAGDLKEVVLHFGWRMSFRWRRRLHPITRKVGARWGPRRLT